MGVGSVIGKRKADKRCFLNKNTLLLYATGAQSNLGLRGSIGCSSELSQLSGRRLGVNLPTPPSTRWLRAFPGDINSITFPAHSQPLCCIDRMTSGRGNKCQQRRYERHWKYLQKSPWSLLMYLRNGHAFHYLLGPENFPIFGLDFPPVIWMLIFICLLPINFWGSLWSRKSPDVFLFPNS